MVFEVITKVRNVFENQRRDVLSFMGLLGLFLIVLVVFESLFFGHVQSLFTTLGAYIQALLDQVATNDEAVVGISLVSYIFADAIVKQALWKLCVAYLGLFGSFFLIWNFGLFHLQKKVFALTKKTQIWSFALFTKQNLKLFAGYIGYSFIFLLFNLKFSLIDSVVLGSSWQESALLFVHTIIRILFLFLVLRYYVTGSFKTTHLKKQIAIFIFGLVTLFVFDTVVGYLAILSGIFYILGFLLFVLILTIFWFAFTFVSKQSLPKIKGSSMSITSKWVQSVILILFAIMLIPTSSLFLLEGIENSGVITEKVTLGTVDEVAQLLRTTTDELRLLSESGVDVLIVEFSDFDCPFCATAQSAVDELHERDSVFVYRRHFPVTSLHPQSYTAATYYECLKDAGYAYEARAFLYNTQSQHTTENLDAFATDLALNVTQVRACMGSAKINALVKHDIDAARALGMSATPTYYLIPLSSIGSYVQVDGADTHKIETFLRTWVKS